MEVQNQYQMQMEKNSKRNFKKIFNMYKKINNNNNKLKEFKYKNKKKFKIKEKLV
jgi:hypothetical protein